MKKGVTPIVAVILLLMMTVAAAGAAFFWLIKIQGQMQGGAEQYEEQVFERIASSVNWQGADYNRTLETLTIYLQNAGTTEISLTNSSTDPTTTWILKDSEQVGICSSKWTGSSGAPNCIEGCDTTLDQAATTKIVLNLSGSNCDISDYANDSLMYVDIYFSGKASTSGTFEK